MPVPAVADAAEAGHMSGAKRRPGLRGEPACHMAATKSAADVTGADVTAAEAATHMATAEAAAHMATTHVATTEATAHMAAAATHVTTATAAVAGRECAARRKRERCCENCCEDEFLAHDIPTFGKVALHVS
jgi:hypothetical protein